MAVMPAIGHDRGARRQAGRDSRQTEAGMKVREWTAVIGTAVVLSGAGAVLLPAAASTGAATHTLKFTSVQQSTTNFSKTSSGAEDKDVNKAGKVIGFDVLQISFNPKKNTATINVTVDTKGGLLYGVLTGGSGAKTNGKVTGGTGTFKGASGTITATSNKANTKTAVTITYHK
jgi:hypothetical protein